MAKKTDYEKAEAALSDTIKVFKSKMPVWVKYFLPQMIEEGLNKEDAVEEIVEMFREEAEAIIK